MESSEDVLPVSINLPDKWELRDGTHSEVSRRLSAPETPRMKKRSPTAVGHFITNTQQKKARARCRAAALPGVGECERLVWAGGEICHRARGRPNNISCLLTLSKGNYTANVLALVVVLDAYLIANDIDSRAIPGGHPFNVVTTLSDLCLLLYTCEVPILILARGGRLLKDGMFLVDLAAWRQKTTSH